MIELLQSAQGFLVGVLSFVFVLGVIIAIHEYGHLVVAKLFDVRVLTYSLGFGPRIWGFQRGETEYRVSAVPLGGYVKLGGEQPDEVSDDPREFLNKPRWQRILVYLAGPAMNVFLALAVMAGVFMVGTDIPYLEVPPVVGAVMEDSSAALAGLQPGDEIVSLDGEPVDDWSDLAVVLGTTVDRTLDLRVKRGDETFAAQVTPRRLPGEDIVDMAGIYPELMPTITSVVPDQPAAAAGLKPGDKVRSVDGRPVAGIRDFVDYVAARPGEEIRLEVVRGDRVLDLTMAPAEVEEGVGRIGVGVGIYQRYGFFDAFVQSARYNWFIVDATFDVLGRIFTGRASAQQNLAGPIQIGQMAGQAAEQSFRRLLELTALISISIAILNLLPIPVLDGGQITILLVESTMRRDLSFKVKELIAQVGFVLIILLMLAVIYIDISKVLPAGLLPGGP